MAENRSQLAFKISAATCAWSAPWVLAPSA